ncbi:MAG TPA: hypothetical protein PLR25_14595, partial [Planctomycetaceae bacterium]|nr:hypothetical protein [Planctomycetaceae bacterium]
YAAPLAGFAATGDVTPLTVIPAIMPFNCAWVLKAILRTTFQAAMTERAALTEFKNHAQSTTENRK